MPSTEVSLTYFPLAALLLSCSAPQWGGVQRGWSCLRLHCCPGVLNHCHLLVDTFQCVCVFLFFLRCVGGITYAGTHIHRQACAEVGCEVLCGGCRQMLGSTWAGPLQCALSDSLCVPPLTPSDLFHLLQFPLFFRSICTLMLTQPSVLNQMLYTYTDLDKSDILFICADVIDFNFSSGYCYIAFFFISCSTIYNHLSLPSCFIFLPLLVWYCFKTCFQSGLSLCLRVTHSLFHSTYVSEAVEGVYRMDHHSKWRLLGEEEGKKQSSLKSKLLMQQQTSAA